MAESDDTFITIQTLHAVASEPRSEADVYAQNTELKIYADQQFRSLKAAQTLIGQLQEKIEHLQSLLADSVPVVRKIQVPHEQAIVEIQIEKIREDAFARQLSLDETKRLDLLIRNLHAIKAKQADIATTATHEKYSNEALLAVVTQLPAPVVDAESKE